jgi:hypothetical protein
LIPIAVKLKIVAREGLVLIDRIAVGDTAGSGSTLASGLLLG